ncbi:MAG: ATP-binding protein [Sporichthyaceae bacterium]
MTTGHSRGGVVAFLFTDLVSSTALAARLGEDAAEELRRMHFALLRKAIAEHAGEEVKNLGDGIMAVFTSPVDAAEAAVAVQTAIAEHNVERPDRQLAVRVGLQAGEPVREEGDYFGTPVVVAARLCAAARGGQILSGDLLAALVGTRGGLTFQGLGPLELKGLHDPVPAAELTWGSQRAAGRPATRASTRRPRKVAPRGPELVGRADELATLDAEFALAAANQFRGVLISGEAGVGKTRLVTEFLRRHSDDATVLQARAHPMSAGVAFGVWAEVLDPLLQVLSDDEVAQLCGGFLDDLSGLFHRVAALRGPWSALPAGHEPPRPRLLAGLVRMLDELCARGPVVILLDDVHWADGSSWEVMHQVARRLDAAPLQVVLTARPVELAEHDSAAPVLFELEQDGLLTRLELLPLQPSGLRALADQIVGAEPTPALMDWLVERSRGNALFAIGLLRALLDERADLSAPVLTRLPEGLGERLAVRARTMPPEQRVVVELLAIVGRPVALADLITLTSSTLEDTSSVLTDLVATRGVVETERGRSLTYELAHPLVRDAAYEQIGGARRRVLHRRVGRMLREAGRVAEAAGHYARSAEPGDPEAVGSLVDALREAEEREAPAEALTVLAALVDLLPPTDLRWLDVLDAMRQRADWITDHRADSHADVVIAALRVIDGQLDDTDDPARRAVVKFRLGHFLGWGAGDIAGGQAMCAAARDLFKAAGDPHRARVAEFELAWSRGLAGEFSEMRTAAQRLANDAESAGDRRAALLGWAALATAAIAGTRFDEGAAANERVRELADGAGTQYRSTVAENQTAMFLTFEGRIAAARQVLAETKLQRPAYRDTSHLDTEATVEWFGGDFPAALAAARESARISPGPRRRRLHGMFAGALAAVESADPTEARRHLNRATTVLQGRDWHLYLAAFGYVEARLNWLAGDSTAALRELETAARGLQDAPMIGHMALLDLAELAYGCVEAGPAHWAAERLVVIAELANRLPLSAIADVAEAWAALADGDVAAAVAAGRPAVEHADATEWRALQARARHVLGRALLETSPTEAATVLQDAAQRYEQCGAVWRRGMVLDLMRRQGSVGRRGSAGRRALAAALGPESLTRRERDVARLAAQGLSVKEIAAQLFVGERTVETHLGNLYAKLGVDSKLDLVRRGTELGLA